MPLQSQVHVDMALSNVSTAILQSPNAFIADKVFPRVPVRHLSNKYFTYPRGFFNRTEAQERAPGTKAAEKEYSILTDTYSCKEYSIQQKIPDKVRDNTDPAIDLDRDAATLVTHDLLIQRDVKWAATYFGANIWTSGDVTGVPATPGTDEVLQWDATNATPVSDIDTAILTVQSNTGIRPNTVVMGRQVFDKVKRSAEFIDLISGGATTSNPALYNEALMARVLGVDRVLIFDSIQNTAKEGQTDTNSFIGGKKCLVCYAAPNPGLMVPTAGYTFSWTRNAGLDITIDTYRDDGISSDWVRGTTDYDMKLVAAELGYFFNDIVA